MKKYFSKLHREYCPICHMNKIMSKEKELRIPETFVKRPRELKEENVIEDSQLKLFLLIMSIESNPSKP